MSGLKCDEKFRGFKQKKISFFYFRSNGSFIMNLVEAWYDQERNSYAGIILLQSFLNLHIRADSILVEFENVVFTFRCRNIK